MWKNCDQNIYKLGVFAKFAKIICKVFAIYGMKQKIRDFTLEYFISRDIAAKHTDSESETGTISSNIRDNVIAESENGKQKIADYISKRLDRN